MSSVKLWINDRQVDAKPAQTIMEAADEAGIMIPRLCNHPYLKPSGSCRLCAVEIEGYRGLPAACTTPVENEMRVMTATPKVLDFRREMLRLILQEHPRECLGCPRNGTCELQRLVAAVGIDFSYPPLNQERPPVKPAGKYFERDYSLCVRCGRCVRVCHEVRGAKAIVFRESQGRQEVGTPFDRSLEEAGCQFCGACVDVCPVGALRENFDVFNGDMYQRTLQACQTLTNIVIDLYRSEMTTSRKTSICPICGAGCRMEFELADNGEILRTLPVSEGSANQGQACVQGRFLLKEYLQRPDRLQKPLIKENGAFRETDWESALGIMAEKFAGRQPGEAAVVTDAAITSEEMYLLREFSKTVLKTDLVGCVSPAGQAASESLLRATVNSETLRGSLRDLSQAGAVIALGANLAASHPIAGTTLHRAVMNGAKLIVANPVSTSAAKSADFDLQYFPGSEPALIGGLIHLLLEENQVDSKIAAQYPQYIQTLKQNLAGYRPEAVARITGVHHETLVEAAQLLGAEKPLCVLYGLGFMESPDVQDSMKALATLLYLTGSLGKDAGGMIPAYGGGNLQGASDLGMTSPLFVDPKPEGGFGRRVPGDIRETLATGRIKALYIASESFGRSLFDSLRPFLGKVEFVALHDVALPASQAEETDPPVHLVLPMASVLEKGGTYISPERNEIQIQPVGSPPGAARPVVWVLEELARTMQATDFDQLNGEAFSAEVQKQTAAGACSAPSPKSGFPAELPEAIRDWIPAAIEEPKSPQDTEFGFAAFSREALEPYFLGPLLATEAEGVFYPGGEVEMNSAVAFRMGFMPGDAVRVVTPVGEWEGVLGMNPLLPLGVVATPAKSLPRSMQEASSGIVPAKVEKAGEAVVDETIDSQA